MTLLVLPAAALPPLGTPKDLFKPRLALPCTASFPPRLLRSNRALPCPVLLCLALYSLVPTAPPWFKPRPALPHLALPCPALPCLALYSLVPTAPPSAPLPHNLFNSPRTNTRQTKLAAPNTTQHLLWLSSHSLNHARPPSLTTSSAFPTPPLPSP
ncbi:hypothetical protein E2C01_055484 [Portunus trituberculatus]|uniref:Uncharacterized protein n=1 Tax=Portunus trituberculatus TaxID=210409 RepID=A0A5B7GRB6_PORTR|nr:hypothetical protein [Portunus trituberculatus]